MANQTSAGRGKLGVPPGLCRCSQCLHNKPPAPPQSSSSNVLGATWLSEFSVGRGDLQHLQDCVGAEGHSSNSSRSSSVASRCAAHQVREAVPLAPVGCCQNSPLLPCWRHPCRCWVQLHSNCLRNLCYNLLPLHLLHVGPFADSRHGGIP